MSVRVSAFLSSSTPNDERELRYYYSFAFFFLFSRLETDASDESLEELLELLSSELSID